MYRIVKSDAVELTAAIYMIQESYQVAMSMKKVKLALPEGTGKSESELEQDDAQQLTAGQESVLNEGAYIAEIKQMAQQQAQAILRDSAQRAQEEYMATLRRAEDDAQTMREEASKQGRAEGVQAQAEHMRQCVEQMEQAVIRMEAEQAAYMVEHEQKLKWLALEIASKVLAKKVDANDAEMVELVRNAVNAAGNAKWISVEVSDQMQALLQTLQGDLAQGKQFELHAISAPVGTCRIETAQGVIDASIDTQIENLKEYFASEPTE